jgi:hypothetical protein
MAATRNIQNNVIQKKILAVPGGITLGTTLLPFDATIPQISEGNNIAGFATSFTPKSILSTLNININCFISNSYAGNKTDTIALFINGAANAVSAGSNGTANIPPYSIQKVSINYSFIPGSLSPITINVRGGGNGTGTAYLNIADNGTNNLGGIISSWMIIEEIL